ncbi:MAG: tetratricopeptide repeat protein [Clostridia bacterium]|nr:tetratricopeptide repeat protein [Clostridia bacterium]
MNSYTEKFKKAEELYDNDSFGEALPLFEELWKETGDGDAALMFANCLKCLDRDDEAVRVYNYIIELDPTLEAPLYNLAGIYYNREEYEKAMELYQKAAEADAECGDAYFKLGECCRMLDTDNTEKAMQYYQKAVMAKEGTIYADDAHFFLGIAYLRLDNPVPAFEHLKKSNELSPDKADTLHFLGLCCEHLNKPDEAMEYYKKALALEDSCDTHINLALCYKDKGDTEKALFHTQTAYELNPEDAFALFYYCKLLSLSGEPRKAYTLLKETDINFDKEDMLLELQVLLALDHNDGTVADEAYSKLKAISPDRAELLGYSELREKHIK